MKAIGHLNTQYPFSQLAISLGFFFVYFVEELSHWLILKLPSDTKPPIKKQVNNYTSATVTPIVGKVKPISIEQEYKKEVELKKEEEAVKELELDENHEPIVYDSLSLSSEVLRENEKNLKMSKEIELPEEVEIQESLEHAVKCRQQSTRCLLIVIALSLHAIVEGLAIGLQKNSSEIWYMFIATSIHSATILFCIGLELLLAKRQINYIIILMLILSVASPLGVFIGLLITIKTNTDTVAKSIAIVLLEGLSAGTLLYITFFEILNREKERRVYRLPRAFCIIAGFLLMALLQALER